MTGPTIKRHQSKQDYGTPKIFIEAVEKRFGKLSWDLAADKTNHKAACWLDDAFGSDWYHLSGILWLNPPFNDITPWARKCAEEAKLGANILLLTPASIGSNWFRDYVWGKAKVLALCGRLTFEPETQPYPKDCILSIYNPREGLDRPFEIWDWMG